jgi:hypothetical protein
MPLFKFPDPDAEIAALQRKIDALKAVPRITPNLTLAKIQDLVHLDQRIEEAFASLKPGDKFEVKFKCSRVYGVEPTREVVRIHHPGIDQLLEQVKIQLVQQGFSPCLYMDPPAQYHRDTGYDRDSDAHWSGGEYIVLTCTFPK